MSHYQEIIEILNNNNVVYRDGIEIQLPCVFNDCDNNKQLNQARMYINKNNGTYLCHKCGEKGNIATLKRHFGIESAQPMIPKRIPVSLDKQALMYHDTMPNDIKEYLLNERMLSQEIIDSFQLGYIQRKANNPRE